MNFNAPILVIVPPRTAAGSRSDPRLGLGVIYGDFGEAALLMQWTRQQVWCWLIGHDAPQPTLSGAGILGQDIVWHNGDRVTAGENGGRYWSTRANIAQHHKTHPAIATNPGIL